MTNSTNASNSLDVHPTASWSPQPSDSLPAISYEQASSLKQELLANEEWRTKYVNGDIECRRQMDQIYRGLTTPPAAPVNPGEAIVEHLRQYADISEDVADEIRSGRASTPYEYQRALELRDHLFQDEEWVQKYNKGDRRAHTQVALINSILSRRVRDNPQEK